MHIHTDIVYAHTNTNTAHTLTNTRAPTTYTRMRTHKVLLAVEVIGLMNVQGLKYWNNQWCVRTDACVRPSGGHANMHILCFLDQTGTFSTSACCLSRCSLCFWLWVMTGRHIISALALIADNLLHAPCATLWHAQLKALDRHA